MPKIVVRLTVLLAASFSGQSSLVGQVRVIGNVPAAVPLAAGTTDVLAEQPRADANIYFRNGDHLPGMFVAHESDNQLRWQTELFVAPGTFDLIGVDNVVFGPSQLPQPTEVSRPQAMANRVIRGNPIIGAINKIATLASKSTVRPNNKQTEPQDVGARVETIDGHVLFGNVIALDEDWLSMRSARHGQYKVRRDRVARIVGLSQDLKFVFDATGGLQNAVSLGAGRSPTDWNIVAGRLTTSEVGANFYVPVKHDGPIVLELVVSGGKRVDFLVAMGAQENIKLVKSAPSVETWGSRLIAHRQVGSEFEHTVLMESRDDTKRLQLDIFLDQENGRMLVYSGATLLDEFTFAAQQDGKGTGIFLRNNGPDLTVEQFRVKTWNGRTTPIQPAAENVVQLADGRVIAGQVVSIQEHAGLTMLVSGVNDDEGQSRTIAVDDIDQIVFAAINELPPNDQSSEGPRRNVSVRYVDGGFVTGTYVRTDADGLVVEVKGIEGQFKQGWSNMGRVAFLHDGDADLQEQAGVIERPGVRIHGRVVQASGDGNVLWQPFASQHAVPLNLSTTAKVVFDSVSATHLDSQLTDELHLTSGDTIPCRLLAIDNTEVHVRFADGTEGSVAREHFKGIRRRPRASYIYSGFQEDEIWHVNANDPLAFELLDGVLEFKRTCYLSRDVGLTERACISFDAQWTGDCTLFVGYGADESSEAVRRRPNTGYTTKMMEREAKRPRDFYGEVSLTRAGKSLSATAYLRSSGLMGQAFANQNPSTRANSSVLAIDDDSVVNIDIYIDRSQRRFSVAANGKTLRSWKEAARVDGSAIYLGFATANEQSAVNFGWGAVVQKNKSHGRVRVSNLRVARWPGAMSDDKKDRLLTRRLGARPKTVTHAIRAFNGDTLRGSLVAVENENVLFKSRLDTITIPLEKVAEIIALREKSPPDDERFSLELHGGGSVVMSPVQVTESLLIGESPQVGRLAVPWQLVSQLNVGDGYERSVSNLVSWTLRAPPALPSATPPDDEPAVSPLVGKPAPDLELVMLDGTTSRLSDLEGKTVILDFWATWCVPCVAALPQAMELATERADDCLLIAVNQQEDTDTIETFLATHGWDDLAVALDDDGNVGRQFGVSAIPQTVVIDSTGIVRHVHVGASPDFKSTLRQAIVAEHVTTGQIE